MARNKYPKETVDKILETAQKLFMEKGYDHTSLQDIINNLGGLTKGAIYHHFKSKEDIMLAVMNRIYEKHDINWKSIVEEEGLTGIEKLKRLFRESLLSASQTEMFNAAPDLLKNPKMLALQIQDIFEDTVPNYIEPIIRQGVEDGTIKTNYPKEMAEVILVLVNLWLSPIVVNAEPEVMRRRFQFFNEILDLFGLNIFDDEMYGRLEEIRNLFAEKQQKLPEGV